MARCRVTHVVPALHQSVASKGPWTHSMRRRPRSRPSSTSVKARRLRAIWNRPGWEYPYTVDGKTRGRELGPRNPRSAGGAAPARLVGQHAKAAQQPAEQVALLERG